MLHSRAGAQAWSDVQRVITDNDVIGRDLAAHVNLDTPDVLMTFFETELGLPINVYIAKQLVPQLYEAYHHDTENVAGPQSAFCSTCCRSRECASSPSRQTRQKVQLTVLNVLRPRTVLCVLLVQVAVKSSSSTRRQLPYLTATLQAPSRKRLSSTRRRTMRSMTMRIRIRMTMMVLGKRHET